MNTYLDIYRGFDQADPILPHSNWHLSARTLLALRKSCRNVDIFEEELNRRIIKDPKLKEYLETTEATTVASHMKGILGV